MSIPRLGVALLWMTSLCPPAVAGEAAVSHAASGAAPWRLVAAANSQPDADTDEEDKPAKQNAGKDADKAGAEKASAKTDDGDDESDKNDPAALRFPQPVRVGDLIGRAVLQPVESQRSLGHVSEIVRGHGGAVQFVIEYGGWFGFDARPIAVPIGAMALLGSDVEIVDFKPEQLQHFPTFMPEDGTALAADETIRVGVTRPSH